jgi:hypothetical protein
MSSPKKFSAFVAGHYTKGTMSSQRLLDLLDQVCTGIIKVSIPNNNWTGYAFIQFKNEIRLKAFLALDSVLIAGSKLTIKEVRQGASLAKFKSNFNKRRLFIRVRAPF